MTLRVKSAEPFGFAAEPGGKCAMPGRNQSPEQLADEDGPQPGSDQAGVVVFFEETELVTGNQADDFRVPATEGGAAVMPGYGFGYKEAANTPFGAAQTEIDILHVRTVGLVVAAEGLEDITAEQTGGAGSGLNGVRPGGGGRGRLAVAGAPGATSAADEVVGAVDNFAGASVEDGAGGEGCRPGGVQQTFQPVGIEFNITVQNGDPRFGAFAPTDIHGAGEAAVGSEADDVATGGFGKFGCAVSGTVINHDDADEGDSLGAKRCKQAAQKCGAVKDGNDGGDLQTVILARISLFCENFWWLAQLLVSSGPMREFDAALKKALMQRGSRWFRMLTGCKSLRWLNVELNKSRSLRVDLLGMASNGEIYHFELQSHNDLGIWLRMAEYALAIYRKYGRWPVQFVIYVGAEPMRMKDRMEGPGYSFRFNLLDARTLETEPLLASPSIGDNVIAILTRLGGERETVRRILKRIARGSRPSRIEAMDELYTIAGLRSLETLIQEEMDQMPILIDIMKNKVLGPPLRKARREGRREGTREGIHDGQLGTVLRLAERRFGPVPSVTRQRIQALTEVQLRRAEDRLLDARSIEDLLVD